MQEPKKKSSERPGMDKLIPFPPERVVRVIELEEEVSENEVKARVTLMRTLHVQEVVEALMPIVFSQLSIGGFDLSDEADIKDAAFITEAIRSVLCKQKGIDHPFQQLADKIFMDEDNGVLSVVDSINIKFGSLTEETEPVVEEATPT